VAGTLAVQLLILYLPVLQGLFDTQARSPVQLGAVLAASTVAFIAVEIEKWVAAAPQPELPGGYA
jgi:P-type Ca2+ transporter type 2C